MRIIECSADFLNSSLFCISRSHVFWRKYHKFQRQRFTKNIYKNTEYYKIYEYLQNICYLSPSESNRAKRAIFKIKSSDPDLFTVSKIIQASESPWKEATVGTESDAVIGRLIHSVRLTSRRFRGIEFRNHQRPEFLSRNNHSFETSRFDSGDEKTRMYVPFAIYGIRGTQVCR